MGWFDTIRSALGWRPPLVVRDDTAPVVFTDAAVARLATLPPGHGVHVETVPVLRGRAVRVTEGESQGPPPPGFELSFSVSDTDLARLRGRELDVTDGRWVVHVPFELRVRETPNPDARSYLCDHVLGLGRPLFHRPGPADDGPLPDLVARLIEVPGVRSVLIRDNTVNVERAPGAAWDPIDAGVDAALREHLLLCGEPVTATAAGGSADALEGEIRRVLAEQIAPAIHRDGGDVEFVGFSNGVVTVSMVGACRTCPSSSATLHHGIERTLREAFPGRVERVEQA
ncbi:MAG: NifU family protein [Myxococcota bacterium]